MNEATSVKIKKRGILSAIPGGQQADQNKSNHGDSIYFNDLNLKELEIKPAKRDIPEDE